MSFLFHTKRVTNKCLLKLYIYTVHLQMFCQGHVVKFQNTVRLVKVNVWHWRFHTIPQVTVCQLWRILVNNEMSLPLRIIVESKPKLRENRIYMGHIIRYRGWFVWWINSTHIKCGKFRSKLMKTTKPPLFDISTLRAQNSAPCFFHNI